MKKTIWIIFLALMAIFGIKQKTWALNEGMIRIDLQYNGGYAVTGVMKSIYHDGEFHNLGWDETVIIPAGTELIIGKYDTYITAVYDVNPNLTYAYIPSFYPTTEVKFTAVREFSVHGNEELFMIFFQYSQFISNFNYRASSPQICLNYVVTDIHCDNEALYEEIDDLKNENGALLYEIGKLNVEMEKLKSKINELGSQMSYYRHWDLDGNGIYNREEARLILRSFLKKD